MRVWFPPLINIFKQIFISLPVKLALIDVLDKTLCRHDISSIYTPPRVYLSLLPTEREREQARENTEDNKRLVKAMSFPQKVS